MALLPMAMYGLEVPPGDMPMMAHADIPAAFRITMAAIDPSAEPEGDEDEIAGPRATLKVLRVPIGEELSDEDSGSDVDMDEMDAKFGDIEDMDDDGDSSDDEDLNGGPSDPTKSKKAKREAVKKEIETMLQAEGMDVDDESDEDIPNGINGIAKSKKAKGKMPAGEDEDEDDSDLDSDEEGGEIEEFVICTLDPNKHYQQPLDITFGEDERVWFKVSGTHTIYLTGNYVEPANSRSGIYDPDSDEEEEEYDLSPDEDELDGSEDESVDGLDDLADPRITELDEDDEAPALIQQKINAATLPAKGKNKRPAEDSGDEAEAGPGAETLDEMITTQAKIAQPIVNGDEQKLSKKQRKKLKKEQDAAAAAAAVAGAPVTKVEEKLEVKKEPEPPSSSRSDKKVTFASELEQGPTPTKVDKPADKAAGSKAPSLGVKTVQGVKLDDRKLGSGISAKNGDRVSMRYIGKLEGGKVFDSNKKGKPLSFKIGTGEVVKGMEIGVTGMQAGSERRVTIPAHLGYGSKKMADIPPNSTLIFDIKLLEINKSK